ncbi:hypothetical protein BLJAPNOD_02330 [Ensifer sp. M14]|nr:hypothetical protein BLJAPNOD_02330 [Ensifer sp. M14]
MAALPRGRELFAGLRLFVATTENRGIAMLKWALIFFVVSLIAGFLGFSGVSAATAGIAKILFYIALAVFLIFLVLAFMAGSAVV